MQGITFLVAAWGFVLAFMLKPRHALLAYCAVLFGYPELLTLSIGTIDFNAPRITVLGLLANLIFRSKAWQGLRWNWLDTMMVMFYFFMGLAALKNAPFMLVIERQFGGQMFDILFPYFAARMALRTRDDMLTFFKGLVYIGIPLALFALYESITGFNVYSIFYVFYGWGLQLQADFRQVREVFGMPFTRAAGSFGISILLGLFFSALATITIGLWREKIWSTPKSLILFAVLVGGTMASVSSAPLFAIAVSLGMVFSYRLRRLWPVLAIGFLGCMIFVEVYSNRHFYHVLTWLSFSTKTASYRIYLLEEAFTGGMDEHWMLGYGYVGVGPGNDNTNFHWHHRDITNLYLAILVRFGLLGLTPYLIVNIMYYRRLYVAAKSSRDKADLWMIWCLSAALVGWSVAMLTVGAFRQIAVFHYLLIALCNNLPGMIRARATVGAARPEISWRRKFYRPPWRHTHGRRFGGDRQLERPGAPSHVPGVSSEGYRQT